MSMKRMGWSVMVVFGLCTLMATIPTTGQEEDKITTEGKIEWITFEEAVIRSKAEPRPIFVDVFTDWCGWCKKMDKTTFENPEVEAYMGKRYYCIKFNAEGKTEVKLPHKTYTNSGKTHDLAKELLDEKLSYPTIVFMTKEFTKLQAIPGYRNADEFLKMSTFFGDEIYKKQSWEDYLKTYQN